MESSNSKLALLLGTDLFSLKSTDFQEVATNNKRRCRFITIEVGPKRSRELFKLPLVT